MERHKGIGVSVMLATGIVVTLALVAAASVMLVVENMRNQALTNAKIKAQLLADHNLAIHTYFNHDLKPKLFELTEPIRPEGYFDPTWMSSTFAVREMDGYFKHLSPESYYYKECAINARSPQNEAKGEEITFLEELQTDPALMVHADVHSENGKAYFAFMRRGETMEQSCLMCHSDPNEAPAGLVARYGDARSFHRKEGDVVSAVSVRIPLVQAYANVRKVSTELSLELAALILLASVALFWIVRALVAAPLNRITGKATQIATSLEHLGESIPLPRGREFRNLAAAFNELSRSLKHSQSHLEQQVEERTEGLRQANEELEQEIAERKRTEEALRESEKEYRLLFESMTTAFALHEIVLDEQNAPCDYRFLEVNKAFEEMTGLCAENIIGKTVRTVIPDIESIWIEQYGCVAVTGESAQFESYSASLDRHFDVTAYAPRAGRFAVIFQDITGRKVAEEEQRQLERRIQQTQKLESLGVLAGGIAHDFNNILMAVLGHASMALEELSPMSPACESIQEIERAARRAAELCRQMLAYSGRGKFVIEPIELRDLIEEMIHLLKTFISKKAILNLNLEKKLPPMQGDATQIRQVIMNLVVNASEAIGERSGVITISTGALDCTREYLAETCLDEDLVEGLYVYIEVSDTGCGMDKDTLSRLFEPFFTTKFTGRGLGMSAVLGIVRGHRGALKVYSEVGKGTTFKILFPALEDETELQLRQDADLARDWAGKGKVLLVDDEETIRALGKKMLERLGFEVTTAGDGREAVDIYANSGSNIDVVLLDLTMPHMNGEETFRELRRLDPNVLVVISSGYTEHEVAARFAGKGLAGFIQKPYNLAVLRERLHMFFKDDASEQ